MYLEGEQLPKKLLSVAVLRRSGNIGEGTKPTHTPDTARDLTLALCCPYNDAFLPPHVGGSFKPSHQACQRTDRNPGALT